VEIIRDWNAKGKGWLEGKACIQPPMKMTGKMPIKILNMKTAIIFTLAPNLENGPFTALH